MSNEKKKFKHFHEKKVLNQFRFYCECWKRPAQRLRPFQKINAISETQDLLMRSDAF